MIDFQNLQSFISNENLFKSQKLTLKPGQIFYGGIVKLYPDDLALIQLGGVKLHAKLHAALDINMKYWFQVVPNENMIELKIIEHSQLNKTNNNQVNPILSPTQFDASQLLKQLGLATTSENEQLISMVVKDGLPITKDGLKQASEWLKDKTDIKRALIATKFVIQNDLPMNHNILNSMYAVYTKESLSSSLVNIFADILDVPQKTSTMMQLANLLQSVILVKHQDEAVKMIQDLLKFITKTESNAEQKTAQGLLHKLGFTSAELNELKSLINSNERIILEKNAIILKVVENNNTAIKQALLHHNEILTEDEINLLNKTIQPLNESSANWGNGKVVLRNFIQLFNSLGLNYERSLLFAENKQEIEANLQTLKPLLMKVLSDEVLTPHLKDKLDQLLQRITGQQLLFSSEQGPVQQLIMQIPIQLQHFMTDLTIQWSGRRGKNGDIDPDFCRIVFYIDLAHIKETLVDVHVQNRIVNIRVYNETPQLDILVKKLMFSLKENLNKLNYHLSSIKVVDQQQSVRKVNSIQTKNISSANGVDFRV
ncbi:hypothetical protein [Calidifontibacillus oryziterrae]|uniref:hypothetical protein n=1 Tax=Calidifontibacillus oryziterrae TaxID=1191699 RepID=UPI0002ECF7BD|nr:hypothetical protein [Calidifontibacillus oryziterrae]